MNITVVIPTHQRRDSLRRALASLAQQTYASGRFDVVVGADHCTDGTMEMLSVMRSATLRVVESRERGAAAARNAALAAATGDVVVFMDDDMEAGPHFVQAHADAHLAEPGESLIVIGYAPVETTSSSSPLARSLASGFDRYFAALAAEGDAPRDPGIPGGNFSARAELLARVGGFDESLPCREDLDLGIRLRRGGGKVRYVPAARATQHVEVSIDDMIARAGARADADLELLRRYPEEAKLLEIRKALSDAPQRRRFHLFWALGGLIEATATALQHFAPSNARLGSWRYRARYARRARQSLGSWSALRNALDANTGSRTPLRIIHLLGSAQPGGVETFVIEMARHVGRSHCEMSVCILDDDGPVAAELRALGIIVTLLGRSHGIAALRRFASLLTSGRFDVLHAHAGGRAHRILARRVGKAKVIRHLHGIGQAWIDSVRRGDARAAKFFSRTFSACDLGLVCSAWLAERVNTSAGTSTPISIFRYGVDIDRFGLGTEDSDLRIAVEIPENIPIVGFVGRMVPQKGLPALIDIAAKLSADGSEAIVVALGDGPLLEESRDRVRSLGLENVRFTGATMSVAGWMKRFDVLAVTSSWEPFGIVSLEAMAAGTPVVAFAIDGVPEAIIDGETGFLVGATDIPGFVQKLREITEDEELRRALGANGRRRVADGFDIRTVANNLEAVYEAVAEDSRPRVSVAR